MRFDAYTKYDRGSPRKVTSRTCGGGRDLGETGGMANYEGYCVKCREKREFEGAEVELANGRRAAQGACPVCGTKMNRMLGKQK